MIKARPIFCLVGAALLTGAAPGAEAATIPPAYWGEWTNQPRFCNSEGDDLDSVLTVTETSVGYFENLWRVRAVRKAGRGLRVTYHPRAEFDMYAPSFLRLSPDGMRIFTSDDQRDTGYKRCPKGKS